MQKRWVVLAVADIGKKQANYSPNKGICGVTQTHTVEKVYTVNFSPCRGGEIMSELLRVSHVSLVEQVIEDNNNACSTVALG